jgi:RsiW-degrading membrane proteinase PrsW (M82 family)
MIELFSELKPSILFCILLSFLPILLWIYFFQKKHFEKRKFVILTFIAGMFAVVPIKLYEKNWDTAVFYLEHLNLFQYLSELVRFPTLSKLLAFVTVNALVAFGFYIFVALAIFVLEVFSGDNSQKVFRQKSRRIFESPLLFISIGILCGIVAYLFSFSVSQRIWFFVIVGMLEEYIKHLVLRFSDDEKIKNVDDAISFAIIIALGFSFVENIFYLQDFLNTGNVLFSKFLIFFILRSTISIIAHVCFSAIFGYFYGIAHFAEEIYQTERQKNQHRLIMLMHKILHLKSSTIFREEMMMEGMLLAMLMHAIFNSLLEFEKTNLLIPGIMLLFFIVLNLFHRKKINIQIVNYPTLSYKNYLN